MPLTKITPANLHTTVQNMVTTMVTETAVDSASVAVLIDSSFDNIVGGTGITYTSASKTFDITNTGVSAGSYGSASLVPILTINAQGQVTSASTTSVAGVSSTSFDSASGIFTISTADGGSFNTTIADSDFTTKRARESISATGSLSYNSGTGVMSYTQGSTDTITEGSSNLYFTDARARAALSASGDLSYNSSTGAFSVTTYKTANFNTDLAASDTNDLSEGSTNLYYTDTRSRSAISLGTAGSQAYNSTTGVFTIPGTTDHINEGSNLFYTNARADARVNLQTGSNLDLSSKSTSDLSEGTNLYYTTTRGDSDTASYISGNRTYGNITTTGYIAGPASFTIDPAAVGDNTGTVIIAGNLTVNGTTTTVNSTTVEVGDNILVLNADETGVPSQNAGIEIERGTSTNVQFIWDEANDRWSTVNQNLALANLVVNGTVDGRDVATDGTKLDGIEAGATADQTITAGSGLTGGGTGDVTISHSDTSSQASVNNSMPNVIQDVTLDTYGHVTGLASANLDDRYYTETEADSRFVNVTGDTMTGDLLVQDDIKATGMVRATGWWNSNSGTDGGDLAVEIGVSSGEGYILSYNRNTSSYGDLNLTANNIDLTANSGATAVRVNSNIVFHDGYHPNADKWTTARTLSLSGDASGSVSWDGSANATLSVAVADDSHTHDTRYLQLTGGTLTGNVAFGDNNKAIFGAGSDLQIYHTGLYSFISDQGTGGLYIDTNGSEIALRSNTGSENMLLCQQDGAVTLYYDNSAKLATTSAGVDVTNQLNVGGNDTGGQGLIHVYGGSTGEGGEIRIFPSAAEDTIVDHWSIDVAADDLRIFNSNGDMAAQFNVDGAANLYYDNTLKLNTSSAGVSVTGTVTATSFSGDGSSLTGITSIPSGVIVMWSGSTGSIPSGWYLCDGTNSTPDLRDRFIVGAGSSYAVGATGGANTVALATGELPSHSHNVGNLANTGAGDHSHNFNANTGNSGNHSHSGSTSNTGSHYHTQYWSNQSGGNQRFHQMKYWSENHASNNAMASAGAHSHNFNTSGAGDHSHNFNANTGNSGNHAHSISGSTGAEGSGTGHENRPPYYALAYIMKG